MRRSMVNELGPVGRAARRLPAPAGFCHRCSTYLTGADDGASVLVKHGARFHRVCADRTACRARCAGQGSLLEESE